MNGAITEVENPDSDIEEEEDERVRLEEKKNSESRRRNLDRQQIQLAGQIISRDLNQELLRREESDQIRRVRLFSWLICVISIGFVILEYQLKLSRINSQKGNLELILAQSNQFSDLQQIIQLTNSLVLLGDGVRIPQYTNVTGQPATAQTDEQKLREYLRAAVQSFNLKSIEIFEARSLASQSIRVYFDLQTSQEFDLDYSTR